MARVEELEQELETLKTPESRRQLELVHREGSWAPWVAFVTPATGRHHEPIVGPARSKSANRRDEPLGAPRPRSETEGSPNVGLVAVGLEELELGAAVLVEEGMGDHVEAVR
jgi:hypothetical protein